MNAGVILAIGLALLVPLALSLLYRDGSWASFLLPVTLMFAAGIVGIRATRPRGRAPEYVSNRDVVPETVRIAVFGLFAAWIGVFRHSDVHLSPSGELTPLSSVTAVAWDRSGPLRATRSSTLWVASCLPPVCSSGGWRSSPSWHPLPRILAPLIAVFGRLLFQKPCWSACQHFSLPACCFRWHAESEGRRPEVC